MQVDPPTASVGQPIRVRCQIKNVGDKSGAEVAQLYVHPIEPSVERPVRELKSFAKVWLNPGEKREVSFAMDQKAFQYFDAVTHQFKTDTGRYQLEVGASSRDVRLTQNFELNPTIPSANVAH
jgi:beta-glucosidase